MLDGLTNEKRTINSLILYKKEANLMVHIRMGECIKTRDVIIDYIEQNVELKTGYWKSVVLK